MKEILKITVVLIVIACVAGALLGVVNEFTKIDQNKVLQDKLSKIYACESGFTEVTDKVSNVDSDITKKSDLYQVFKANDGSNTLIFRSGAKGYDKQNKVEMMIIIKNNEIIKIEKYSSKETAGVGTKAYEEKYLQKYLGNIAEIDAFKFVNNSSGYGDVMVISGATKTCNAVINCVNRAVWNYKQFKDIYLAV